MKKNTLIFALTIGVSLIISFPSFAKVSSKHYWAILTALSTEAQPFQKAIKNKRTITINRVHYTTGNIDKRNIVLAITGIGKVNAAAITTSLIKDFHPQLILLAGVAGGVSNNLNVGDIIIGRKLYSVEHSSATQRLHVKDQVNLITHKVNPIVITTNNYFIRSLEEYALSHTKTRIKIISGTIATTDVFPPTRNTLIALQQKNINAIEMEGFAVAQVGLLFQTPTVVVKAISDAPLKQELKQKRYIVREKDKLRAEQNVAEFVIDFIRSRDVR